MLFNLLLLSHILNAKSEPSYHGYTNNATETATVERERIVWVDWMRVICCFMVMVVHATEPFYLGEGGILTEADVWWVSLFEGLTRMCVPLFVIASGYLLFPVRGGTGRFLKRRVQRVLIPFALWSLFYAWYWSWYWGGEAWDNFSNLLWNFNYASGHLWFVYMLLGLYLLMPLLSPWAERVGKRELQLYLFLCLFTSMIPLFRDWLSGGTVEMIMGPTGIPNRALYPMWGEGSWNAYGTFYYFSGFMGYMLLGLYLRRFGRNWNWTRTLAVAMPCLLTGFAISFEGFLCRAYEATGGMFPASLSLDKAVWLETTLCNDTISVALMTIGWVLLIRKFFGVERFKVYYRVWVFNRLVLPISKASYGMYLGHMVVLSAVSAFLCEWLGRGNEAQLGMWTTPVQILGTALLSYVIVAIAAILLQRIPKVGKYVVG